jgi:4-hydroxybenzoate polyprenyltransferase
MEENGIRSGLKSARNFFSLVKFSHTVFAMPFALIGFTLAVTVAGHDFSLRLLLLVVLCMIFARNAAMGFNRLVDREFDAMNPRTNRREIPAGIIKPWAATVFVIVNAVLFIATTAFINRLTLYLSPVALAVILGYSLTKRFTSLSHFILGLGLSLAPIGAYISVTGTFDILPVIFSLVVISWVSGFDIIYALQDDEFDRENRLHSIPSRTGRKNALLISAFVHFITVLLVALAGIRGEFSWIYWTGSAIFTTLLVYQHSIVSSEDLHRVDMAFATTNGIASILFSFFTILSLVLN